MIVFAIPSTAEPMMKAAAPLIVDTVQERVGDPQRSEVDRPRNRQPHEETHAPTLRLTAETRRACTRAAARARRLRREREHRDEPAAGERRPDVVADEVAACDRGPRVARRDAVEALRLRPVRAAVARARDGDAERALRDARTRSTSCGRRSRPTMPARTSPGRRRSPGTKLSKPVPGTRVGAVHVTPSVDVERTIVLPLQTGRKTQSAHATYMRPDASTAAVGSGGARRNGRAASEIGEIPTAARTSRRRRSSGRRRRRRPRLRTRPSARRSAGSAAARLPRRSRTRS